MGFTSFDPSHACYSSSSAYSPESFSLSMPVAPADLTTRRACLPVSSCRCLASSSECVTIQMRVCPSAEAIRRASGASSGRMQAGLRLVQRDQRRPPVAHQRAEQTQRFERAIRRRRRSAAPREARDCGLSGSSGPRLRRAAWRGCLNSDDISTKRCRNVGDRSEENEWIVLGGNETASPPESGSFEVDRVDDQGATFDEVCGRDTPLQRVLEQAGAKPLADPVLIGRKLSQQQAGDGVGR
jgi:hypothetical protein